MARYLIKSFSRVNFKDLVGRTALNFAIEYENIEMVKVLACNYADPNSTNNKG